MKKTLLFAALAVFALCAQAQDPADWTFNAENIEAGSYAAGTDVVSGIYTFTCTKKSWDVDSNTARFSNDSTVAYTQRIKAKGKDCIIKIEAPSAGTLIFGARTGSNSETTRTLVATQAGAELYNAVVQEADTMEHEYGVTPKAYYTTNVAVPAAGTVEVSMPMGNLNYYFIQFTAEAVEDPEKPDTPVDPEDPEDPEDPDTPQPTNDLILDPALLTVGDYAEDYTVGIYTLVVVPGTEETKPWSVDANKASFSYEPTVQHTGRIKPNGKSNYISIAVPEPGILLICPRSGNKDATDRNMVVAQGENVLLDVIVADEQAVDKVYPSYEVAVPAADVVTITNPVNTINYYYIEYRSGTGVKYVFDLNKVTMSNNVVAANGAQKVMVYDATGRLVRVANAQEVDLNKVARGVYIVKAVYANGETQTVKVRR